MAMCGGPVYVQEGKEIMNECEVGRAMRAMCHAFYRWIQPLGSSPFVYE